MTDVLHAVLGFAAVALLGAAGALGAWRWWRVEVSPAFWRLLRAGQAVLLLDVALGGLLSLQGREAGGLHLLYGLLPLAVSFAAEQLRVASAEAVLDVRGIPDAHAVGQLPAAEQRSVVRAIVRREIGVMSVAALVAAALCLRAAFSFGGLG